MLTITRSLLTCSTCQFSLEKSPNHFTVEVKQGGQEGVLSHNSQCVNCNVICDGKQWDTQLGYIIYYCALCSHTELINSRHTMIVLFVVLCRTERKELKLPTENKTELRASYLLLWLLIWCEEITSLHCTGTHWQVSLTIQSRPTLQVPNSAVSISEVRCGR